MRENRQSGSEGGEAELNRSSLPLSVFQQAVRWGYSLKSRPPQSGPGTR